MQKAPATRSPALPGAKSTGDKIAGVTGKQRAPATRSPALPGAKSTGDKIAGVTGKRKAPATRSPAVPGGQKAPATRSPALPGAKSTGDKIAGVTGGKEYRRQDRRRYQAQKAPATRSPALPDVGDGEAFGEGVFGIEDVLREAGDPRLSGERRHDRRVRSDARFFEQAAGEDRIENATMLEVFVQCELAAGVQRRHFRAGAGAARGAIQDAAAVLRRDDDCVLVPVGNLGDGGAADRRILGMHHRQLLARCREDFRRDAHDLASLVGLDLQSKRRRIGDDVEHAAPRD